MSDDINKINLDTETKELDKGQEPIQLEPANPAPGIPGLTNPSIDPESFEATKGLIQNLSLSLDELTIQQRELKERLDNILINDAQLSQLEANQKEAATAYKKRRKDLLESVEAREVKTKMSEVKDEVREIKESLTHHLLNYYQVTGVQSFETPSGDEREFSFSAKIKKAKNQ